MPMSYRIVALCLFACCWQTVWAQNDSLQTVLPSPEPQARTTTPMPYIEDVGSNPFSPAEAAKRSAVLPGWGQVYNKKYWKVPVIYAALGAIAYGIYWNNSYYQYYDNLYKQAILNGNPNQLNLNRTQYLRTFTRRNKELLILVGILTYGLNIADAIVDAHLAGFDFSDDISLRLSPHIEPLPHTHGIWAKGVTFTFRF